MRLRIATMVALALVGVVLGLLSFVFCSSWYVEDELQDLFDADDAMLVAMIGGVALLCLLGVAGLMPRRRDWRWLPLLAGMLLVMAQVVGASAGGVCLSLPGMLRGGAAVWMRVD